MTIEILCIVLCVLPRFYISAHRLILFPRNNFLRSIFAWICNPIHYNHCNIDHVHVMPMLISRLSARRVVCTSEWRLSCRVRRNQHEGGGHHIQQYDLEQADRILGDANRPKL